jgi:hypothetical protein
MAEPAWRDREALRALGWSDQRIDTELRRGSCRPVARGAHLPLIVADDLWQRCGAALTTQHPVAAISRRTAAVALDFPWLPGDWATATDICVDAPREDLTRSSRRGLSRRLSALPPEDIDVWRDLRITNHPRTAVDLARYEQRSVVVPILDWLLTEEVCTREQLRAVCDRMVRVQRVRRARQFIDLARAGVASPRETHTRLRITDAGLPEPDVNLEITCDGVVLAQGDLGYWRWLIWIEYDGKEWHDPRRARGDDQNKDRWLSRRGWEVMRLVNRDYHQPSVFLSQLADAIRDAPARIAALDPSRSPEARAARLLLDSQ